MVAFRDLKTGMIIIYQEAEYEIKEKQARHIIAEGDRVIIGIPKSFVAAGLVKIKKTE